MKLTQPFWRAEGEERLMTIVSRITEFLKNHVHPVVAIIAGLFVITSGMTASIQYCWLPLPLTRSNEYTIYKVNNSPEFSIKTLQDYHKKTIYDNHQTRPDESVRFSTPCAMPHSLSEAR
jgi:hypothetical protein